MLTTEGTALQDSFPFLCDRGDFIQGSGTSKEKELQLENLYKVVYSFPIWGDSRGSLGT